MQFIRFSLLSLAILCTAIGCQPAQPTSTAGTDTHEHGDGHDHGHAEAKTFAEGVEMLGKVSDEIKAANEKGTPDEAHDALHDVGTLLESLPALAAKQTELDDAAKEAIKKSVESLFDSYTKLDEGMHGGEQVEYSTISPAIQTAIDTLKGYVK